MKVNDAPWTPTCDLDPESADEGLPVLDEAAKVIGGARRDEYGDPRESIGRTAELWEAYLGTPVRPRDVCAMMVLLKLARLRRTPDHRDSIVDICGYAALMEEV